MSSHPHVSQNPRVGPLTVKHRGHCRALNYLRIDGAFVSLWKNNTRIKKSDPILFFLWFHAPYAPLVPLYCPFEKNSEHLCRKPSREKWVLSAIVRKRSNAQSSLHRIISCIFDFYHHIEVFYFASSVNVMSAIVRNVRNDSWREYSHCFPFRVGVKR